jgi:hypothetical protein
LVKVSPYQIGPRCLQQTAITLDVSSIQPLERFIGLIPKSKNPRDPVRICRVFRDIPNQCGIRFLLPAKRVVHDGIPMRAFATSPSLSVRAHSIRRGGTCHLGTTHQANGGTGGPYGGGSIF